MMPLENPLLNQDDITIYLKLNTGKIITLMCKKTITIRSIKQILQDREGIPMSMGNLCYVGELLLDDSTLEKYNIQNNDTIIIILNMRGD